MARERYAGFFQSSRKDWTECSVVTELLNALRREGFEALHSPCAYTPDPPDVTCHDDEGKSVAVEVVEAVSREAVHANAAGRAVYRHWEPPEFASHVQDLVRAKDAKAFHGGPYDRVIVCVHTDEPTVQPESVRDAICGAAPLVLAQVSAAYLLFSYDPHSQGYPVMRIPVAN